MKREFLVVGIWLEDHSRFADSCVADTPEEAESIILEKYTGDDSDNPGDVLVIAGVITIVAGAMEVVA